MGMGGRVCGVDDHSRYDTVNEPWELDWPDIPHPYSASAFFALRGLGDGNWRNCLTVGSTVFEARMLRGHRWIVTMLDVRKPPVDDVWFRQGDATAMPFTNGYFNALSSTCCLCHVGLGRYGDAVVERGDRMALKEFNRVLKVGSKASVMFGPCLPMLKRTVPHGKVHRMYAVEDAEHKATDAGFRIDTAGLWCTHLRRWLKPEEIEERRNQKIEPKTEVPYCYLAMLLEKL
jgi:hypothetical protein